MLSFLSFFLLLFPAGQPQAGSLAAIPGPAVVAESRICRMYGSVYLTSDPKQKSYARYIVYVEPEETYADLLVFKENNKLFADGPGLWYMTTNRTFADHVFFVTNNRAFADFSIHFTDKRTFAGCRQ
jgi:Family of unknown function (DUF6150)